MTSSTEDQDGGPDTGEASGAVGRDDDWNGGGDEELHGRLRRDHQQVPDR